MLIPPKYILTPTISKHLQTIEAARSVIDSITIPAEVETNIRRQSTLKSSLFSARIEGNPLTLDDISRKPSDDLKKLEVFNILKATEWVYKQNLNNITTTTILNLHKMVMKELTSEENLGKFRKEVSAIFNIAGIAVYLPPPPSEIEKLMSELFQFINSSEESFIPIRAALSHYIFEKIHPFIDGNGRVGRLLLQAVLQKYEYSMKGLLNIEEYLDSNKSRYYDSLMDSEKDVTNYLEFMLEAISNAAQKTKESVVSKQKIEAADYLLPRRAEILNIIKDHKLIPFDIIRRRFMGVNERTLRYDLKKLQESGFIRKRGTTKGVYYEVI